MSAYVVDKGDIDLLVDAANYAGGHRPFQWWQTDSTGDFSGWRYLRGSETGEADDFTPSMLGQMLVSENVRSVSYRYGGEEAETLPGPNDRYYLGPYVHQTRGYGRPTPGEVFRTIDRLDYQSCETPDWRQTEAFAFLSALRVAYCRFVEGYDREEEGSHA